MSKRANVPLKGKRYVSEKVINSMLEIAIGQKVGDRLAFDGALRHAMGICVAGLAARTMLANISFLQDQVNICCGEVLVEKDFSVHKFREHMDILCNLNLILACMTSGRDSISSEKQSFLLKACGELTQDHICKVIMNVRSKLEEEILGEMFKLDQRIYQNGKKDWREDVRSLLHKKIAPELWSIYTLLGEIRENIDSLVKYIRNDWSQDLSQLHSSGFVHRIAKKDRKNSIKRREKAD